MGHDESDGGTPEVDTPRAVGENQRGIPGALAEGLAFLTSGYRTGFVIVRPLPHMVSRTSAVSRASRGARSRGSQV